MERLLVIKQLHPIQKMDIWWVWNLGQEAVFSMQK
jgi:hypothetical protein